MNTGAWSKKAIGEAKHYAQVNVAADAGEPYVSIPPQSRVEAHARCGLPALHAERDHRRRRIPLRAATGGVPLVADMSSTILSRPIDVAKFGVIYAGAQKNIGPAGLTLVIVRDDLLGRRAPDPGVHGFRGDGEGRLDAQHAADVRLVHRRPGVPVAEAAGRPAGHGERNRAKAEMLYAAIDGSSFYRNPVAKDARSWMNVPFTLANPELDKTFTAEAKQAGLVTLEGHRSVGGMRASLYNAMPMAGVEALVDFMKIRASRHG